MTVDANNAVADLRSPSLHGEDRDFHVTLFDGSTLDISVLSYRELLDLQRREECAFAQRIKRSVKGSAERAAAFAQGYDTVCTIVGRRQTLAGGNACMGFDERYVGLVLDVIARSSSSGAKQQVFEIGYGSGALLTRLAARGIDVAGVEVSSAIRAQALASLPPRSAERLLLGDFL